MSSKNPFQPAGYIIFDAGQNPPRVLDSYGVAAPVVVTPLQQFQVTPSEAVTGGGLIPGTVVPPGTAVRGFMVAGAAIAIVAAPAAGTSRFLQLGETGGTTFDVNIVDATGALANAAAGDTVSVLFYKTGPQAS